MCNFPCPKMSRDPERRLADLISSGRFQDSDISLPITTTNFLAEVKHLKRRAHVGAGGTYGLMPAVTGDRSGHVPHPARPSMKRDDDANEGTTNDAPPNDPPQCRVCFDGPDQELGRLIRPCLCRGSISVCLSTDRHQSQAVFPTSSSFSPLS